MKGISNCFRDFVFALSAILISATSAPAVETPMHCTDDTMIVFDASGSMSGNTGPGIGNMKPRINEVRKALARVLPRASQLRRIGLVTYGPGPYQQCNVSLDLMPMRSAAQPIMKIVDNINPAGKTPLTESVMRAADALQFRSNPGMIVVLTDGEETCGGDPCSLGRWLEANGLSITVHVIGFRIEQSLGAGPQSYMNARCLAEETGGQYIKAKNQDELARAFEQTLGCPMISTWDARSETIAAYEKGASPAYRVSRALCKIRPLRVN